MRFLLRFLLWFSKILWILSYPSTLCCKNRTYKRTFREGLEANIPHTNIPCNKPGFLHSPAVGFPSDAWTVIPWPDDQWPVILPPAWQSGISWQYQNMTKWQVKAHTSTQILQVTSQCKSLPPPPSPKAGTWIIQTSSKRFTADIFAQG